MSSAKDVEFSLKVFVNKLKNKVLFAEAGSDFVDVLISFLTLPLGTIVRVLKKHYADQETPVNIGSLTSLYNGLANLEKVHFWTEGCKEVLLNPRSSFVAECLKLKLDISDTQPTEYFTCVNQSCYGKNVKISCLSIYYDTATCFCGKTMIRKVGTRESQDINDAGGVFTVNTMSFIISDDLQIFPNSRDLIQTLTNLGITDMDLGELRTLTFGFSEIVDLLKVSLLSQTPLSDVIFNKRQVSSATPKSVQSETLCREMEKESTSNSKKMILKVVVQKSTNKLLFARAQEDFVDFLCSLLVIPLGGVECLLGSSTACVKSIDNLYTSVANFDNKHMANPNMKHRLMKAKLPHGYISEHEHQILPLIEASFTHSNTYYFHEIGKRTVQISPVKFVKGQGKYIRGPTMYKITDDLTVTPFCMASMFSALQGQNILLSDLQELEVEIRLGEALSILKASLTSTCALSVGLKINHMFGKKPKQEQ